MSACAIDATPIWQTSFWPPERNVALVAPKRRRRSILELLALAELGTVVPLHPTSEPESEGQYPCTYPGCHRSAANPLPSARQLANHRFAAHGIRSTNEESIKRQQRRDRKRAVEQGKAPEYIDAKLIRVEIEKRFPINLHPETKTGALDPGDREHVRRRLCHLVTSELYKELRRVPAELCIAIAEIAATGLEPMGLNKRVLNPVEAFSAGTGAMRKVSARRRRT